jgi:hypothetical protein
VHRSGAGLQWEARVLRVNFLLLFLGYRLRGLEGLVMLFIWKYCFRIFEPCVGEITTRDLVGTGSSHVCCTAATKETHPGASERQIRTDIESCSEAPFDFTIFVLLPEDTVLNITIPT